MECKRVDLPEIGYQSPTVTSFDVPVEAGFASSVDDVEDKDHGWT